MTIAANVIKEKIRRKELYIIAGIGALIILLFTSSETGIEVGGVKLSAFSSLFPIMVTAVSVFGCILAIVLSLSTIPNEYARNTSHLIWTRGVKQSRYHMELAIGSIISSLIGLVILYISLILFCLAKGEASCILRLPVAFVFSAIPVCIISICVSAFSIKLPTAVVGMISIIALALGFLHTIIATLANILSGVFGELLRGLLKCVPNLYAIQLQGADFMLGINFAIDIHIVLGGLLAIYLLTIPVLLLRKKEA